MAKAISETTRTARVRKTARTEPPRLVSLRVSRRSMLHVWRAGASPNRIPATNATRAVKPSTHRSMEMALLRGRLVPASRTKRGTAAQARISPRTPPATATRMLSVNSWRIMSARRAPRAIQTAISRRRPVARTSRRLATLAQAIRSTTPTAPIKTQSAV